MSTPEELAATYVFSQSELMKTHGAPAFKCKDSSRSDSQRPSVSTAATYEAVDDDVGMGHGRAPIRLFEENQENRSPSESSMESSISSEKSGQLVQ
jgi:hypothetical protein